MKKVGSKFKVLYKDKNTRARVCKLKTAHGFLETPVFMPVATQAVFKGGVDSMDAYRIDAPIILANTYHLYLRGAVPVIKKSGGLHKFMGWTRPILTDSGGFQVWSLGLGMKRRGLNYNQSNKSDAIFAKIDDDGVTFKSYVDGRKLRLTPEKAIKIQQDLGADIIMAFDEATPDNESYSYTKEAMERTHRWALRCLSVHNSDKQLLFGIIQGGRFKRLRIKSARFISSLPFDGIALGGESVGYNMKRTAEILEYLYPFSNEDIPKYTMGVGFDPRDFFTVIEHGIDMFDCVSPARIARHGVLYSKSVGSKKNFRININNAKYKYDERPICNWCDCIICSPSFKNIKYSRSYIRHLFKLGELTALRIATIHNLRFMLKVVEEIREAIKNGRFLALKREWF